MARIKPEDWLSPDALLRIEGWARDGLTDKQIARNIGIGYSTFNRWKADYQELRETLIKGKSPVDTEVENALLKSALGFKTTIKKAVKLKTKRQLKDKGTIEEERIEMVEEEIYIQPKTDAQIFWLKNRRPDKWRDRREYVDTSGDTSGISPDVRNAVEQAVRDYDSAKEADTGAVTDDGGDGGDTESDD